MCAECAFDMEISPAVALNFAPSCVCIGIVTGSAPGEVLNGSASAVTSAKTWLHHGVGTDMLKSPVHVGELVRRNRETACPAVDLCLNLQKGTALYAVILYALTGYPCAEIGQTLLDSAVLGLLVPVYPVILRVV